MLSNPPILQMSASALGLKDKNLKATGGTAYTTSDFIDLGDYRMFMASVLVTQTGSPTVGAAKLSLQLFANDKVTDLGTVDLLTAIGTTVNRQELVTFGRGVTPAKQGNGTIGAQIGVLKVLRWCKLILTVSTQSDATTCLGNVSLFCGN